MTQDPDLLIPKRTQQDASKKMEPMDLVLTPPPPAVKPNRHVQIAINHMELQHEKLTLKIDQLTKERDDLETALKALR